METRGEGLADPFVKLNEKENAAHAPRRGGKKGKTENWGGRKNEGKKKRNKKKKQKIKSIKIKTKRKSNGESPGKQGQSAGGERSTGLPAASACDTPRGNSGPRSPRARLPPPPPPAAPLRAPLGNA